MEWGGKLEWQPYLHHGWTHLGSRPAILKAIDSEDRGVSNEELGLSDLSMDPGQAGIHQPSGGGPGPEVQIPPPALECSKKKKKTASSNTESTVDWKTQCFH